MPRSDSDHTVLDPRDRAILRDVIGTFILTGEPVSSRSVAKHQQHGVSAATIRNVMADLEDLGYLTQPHSSAGRVPTGHGYHFYIDSLMPNRQLSSRDRSAIEAALRARSVEGEQLMTSAGQLLSELSHQIGIVLTPAMGDTELKSINFLPLSGTKVLCILVAASGFIDNKLIETDEPLPADELVRISNYLTENYSGRTIRAIRDDLLVRMAEERARVDQLLAGAIELARRALDDSSDQELVVEGTTSVLDQPELADLERVRRLLETFTDRAGVVRLLNKLIRGPGVRVVIGDESDLTAGLDFSLVAKTYGVGGKTLGTLGVFGPSRMEYQKVIPLVDYFGNRLSLALEEAYTDRDEVSADD